MTAQTPERLILNGKPHALYAAPLYRLLASRRIELRGYHSSCWRGYVGTWEVIGARLYLVHINCDEPPAEEVLRLKLLRAASASQFPIFASWFNGRLRIQIGRRLIYSHHGWSSWFERERLMTFKQGVLARDREVDTRRILEWWLRRNP